MKKFIIGAAWIASMFQGHNAEYKAMNAAEYAEFIKKSDTYLIKFFAPWCGHCKSMAGAYETAGNEVEGVTFVDIDATTNPELASQFGVKGYPTLKFIKNGKTYDYEGGRSKADLVDYVTARISPAVKPVSSMAEFQELRKKNTKPGHTIFLATTATQDSPLYKSYQVIAEENLDLGTFYSLVGAAETVRAFKQDEPEASANFTNDADLRTFVNNHSFPLFAAINGDNFSKYDRRGLPIVWVCGDQDEFQKLQPIISVSAENLIGKYSFVWLNTKQYGGHATSNLNIQKLPGIAVEVRPNRYLFNKPEITQANLDVFFKELDQGRVPVDIKSQEVPEVNDKPVKVVVGSTIESMVYNTDKYVLFEIYAPWCGHCKSLEVVYNALAAEHEDMRNLVIAKMDGTENESPLGVFSWNGFPTLYFVYGPKDSRTVVPVNARERDEFIKVFKQYMKSDYSEPKKTQTSKDEL